MDGSVLATAEGIDGLLLGAYSMLDGITDKCGWGSSIFHGYLEVFGGWKRIRELLRRPTTSTHLKYSRHLQTHTLICDGGVFMMPFQGVNAK
ncbi:MAG: hypothetical protein U5K79_15660 [Cyclobacteriaceae bacterium]|nr:hypothetical protein [Cyclobacteriaceae bacterium]